MTISELIEELEERKNQFGDVRVMLSCWEEDKKTWEPIKLNTLPFFNGKEFELIVELGTASKLKNKTLALIKDFAEYALKMQSLLADAKETIDEIVQDVKEV